MLAHPGMTSSHSAISRPGNAHDILVAVKPRVYFFWFNTVSSPNWFTFSTDRTQPNRKPTQTGPGVCFQGPLKLTQSEPQPDPIRTQSKPRTDPDTSRQLMGKSRTKWGYRKNMVCTTLWISPKYYVSSSWDYDEMHLSMDYLFRFLTMSVIVGGQLNYWVWDAGTSGHDLFPQRHLEAGECSRHSCCS